MARARLAVIVLAAAVCGCGDDAPGGVDPDAAIDAPPGCERPSVDAPWLPELLTGAVAQLASTPRSTNTQRDAARAYLIEQLTSYGWTAAAAAFPNGANVVATIPATPDTQLGAALAGGKAVIVGAHFDTVPSSPGANDNASGVAVVLAVARFLADVPCRASAVTIVMFDVEEIGLFGSRAYAPTVDPDTVHAVHTIDQVGWDGDGDATFELEQPTAALEAEWRAAAALVGATVVRTTTGGTDHVPFRDRGFAAVGLTEEYVGGDTSPHRHTAADTAATIDADYLALAAKLTLQVVLAEISP